MLVARLFQVHGHIIVSKDPERRMPGEVTPLPKVAAFDRIPDHGASDDEDDAVRRCVRFGSLFSAGERGATISADGAQER